MNKFEQDLKAFRAKKDNEVGNWTTEYPDLEEKKKYFSQRVNMPDEIKNNKGITRWVGRFDGEIQVYERNEKGRWISKIKDIPDWAIEAVTKLCRTWHNQ